jgi:A/G-specific adenine glycosylase
MNWSESLLTWYLQSARDLPWRHTKDAYSVWVSEIMLQQTRVAAVIPYYQRWMNALPHVADLAAVEEETLHKLWEGLGYYSRAKNLKLAAKEVMARFDGRVPLTYEALLTLPGIGEYTAGAVASIAGDQAVPAVDGNVLRVMSRLNNDARDVLSPVVRKEVRKMLAGIIPPHSPGLFNQAMMELGATICGPNALPLCSRCPLAPFCKARVAGTADALPFRKAQKPRRVENRTVFVLPAGDGYLGYRRPDKGLLAGLWQLPDVSGHLSREKAAEQLAAWGLRPAGEWLIYARKHVFTHVEWHMQVVQVRVEWKRLPPCWRLLTQEQALPTAYRICLPEGRPA